MTLSELLTKNGLNEEQIKWILADMKSNGIYTASEENLDVRYSKLKTEHEALTTKDSESQKLIAELQKATKGQETVQAKITEYESTIQKLNDDLIQTKTESALKLGLIGAGAKASDVDYLIFKMANDPNWKAELDENGTIKGLDDKVKGMKTAYPSQFESSGTKKIDEKKLPETDPNKNGTITKEDFKRMGYDSRVKLKAENPELYKSLTE